MTLADDIRKDRESGTPGPWVQGGTLPHTCAHDFYDPFGPHGGSVACVSGEPEGEADPLDIVNARRIARVPTLEEAYLAALDVLGKADELASASNKWGTYDGQLIAALTAYRTARENLK